jgi:hypothetical protein
MRISLYTSAVFGRSSPAMPFDYVLVAAFAKTRVCKANHLADVSQELSMLIRARRNKTIAGTVAQNAVDADQRLPAEKARKLARLAKIRQTEGVQDTAPITVSSGCVGCQQLICFFS